MFKQLGVVLALCALAGCGKPADPDQAEQAVPQFHMALIESDFDGIYQRASEDLQKRQPQGAFVAYLKSVRGKLGEVRGADRTGTKVDGRVVTLTYNTVYANGPATEEFVIRAEEGKEPVLVSYRLLSPSLEAPAAK